MRWIEVLRVALNGSRQLLLLLEMAVTISFVLDVAAHSPALYATVVLASGGAGGGEFGISSPLVETASEIPAIFSEGEFFHVVLEGSGVIPLPSTPSASPSSSSPEASSSSSSSLPAPVWFLSMLSWERILFFFRNFFSVPESSWSVSLQRIMSTTTVAIRGVGHGSY